MAKRRFRWSPERQEMVEVQPYTDEFHFIRDDIDPVPSPMDPSVMITSRSKLREVMQQNNLVFSDEVGKTSDRYAEQRQQQEFRERTWEWLSRPGVDRADKRPYRKLKD